MTVGELQQCLDILPDDYNIVFHSYEECCDVTICNVKTDDKNKIVTIYFD